MCGRAEWDSAGERKGRQKQKRRPKAAFLRDERYSVSSLRLGSADASPVFSRPTCE